MKKMLTAALAAASMTLASCATIPTASQINPQVERAQAAYDRSAPTVTMLLPYMSPERAARVRLALSLAQRALIAARAAASAAEGWAALQQAEAAVAVVETATTS